MEQKLFLIAADMILIIHILFVTFAVAGLIAIYTGCFLKWDWIKNFYFRALHLIAIGIVVIQSWIGMICPLTRWENYLRKGAGEETYSGSFIQHWLHSLLYYNAPEWVFTLLYTAFACLVIASWFIIKPVKS